MTGWEPIRTLALAARSASFAAIGLALAGEAIGQGETGFLRGEGRLDAVLSYTLDTYDRFWVGTTKVDDPSVGRIRRAAYNVYAAYGVASCLDVGANLSYVSASSTGIFEREDDLQDLELKLKWKGLATRLGPGEASVLLSPGVKFPVSNYEDNAPTAIGDGQTDYRGRAILHYQLDQGAFLSLETGYDRRAGVPKDETPWNLTVGGTFFGFLTLSPFYSIVRSYGGPDIGDPGFSFPAVQEEYERAGVSTYVRLGSNLGLVGLWRTTLDGRNTGDADAFAFGTVIRF